MTTTTSTNNDYLIRGSDYLAASTGFKLEGRDDELERLTKVLMRKRANNVLMVGPGGVGCSAIGMGLQAAKEKPDAPYDLVSKRFYWLDTDGLFASGNPTQINEAFQRTLKTLSRTPDSVLMIDDMRDFIEGARNNGCSNLINALMREIKQKKFQAIYEAGDDDLQTVLNAHSDMKEAYTLLDIGEPSNGALEKIMGQTTKMLESHHKIKIDEAAWKTAIELTNKYRARDFGLSRAQPERSITLLDRALSTYRLGAHQKDPRLSGLEQRLESVVHALDDPNYSADQGGKSREELEALKASLESDIREVGQGWEEQQAKIKALYKDMRKAEEKIRELEDELTAQVEAEEEQRKRLEHDDEEQAPVKATQSKLGALSAAMEQGNFGSDAVNAIKSRMGQYRQIAEDTKRKFEELTASINDGLVLTKDHVLAEFSSISGVPVDKLTQNEKAKLQNLEGNLKGVIWDQDIAVEKVSNSVIISRAGLKDPRKPEGSYFWLGPSGVGKTELAIQLSSFLEMELNRLDMSEYQEKHAVAKLIGAPPGYEGFDQGGALVRSVRRNPRQVILFDEVEQAHPDIFNILLQVLDAGRLTDSHGITADFSNCIIILTSNIGKEHFVNPDLSPEEAQELAMADLDKHLPPQLLNRFNGRRNIVCFNTLSLPTIEKIAGRDLSKLNAMVQAKNPALSVAITDEDLRAMCKDAYKPLEGARGVVGEIEENIKPEVARTVLFQDSASGVMNIEYDAENKRVKVHPAKPAGDDEQKLAVTTAAKAAFTPAT